MGERKQFTSRPLNPYATTYSQSLKLGTLGGHHMGGDPVGSRGPDPPLSSRTKPPRGLRLRGHKPGPPKISDRSPPLVATIMT
jgi:hypothetical protein